MFYLMTHSTHFIYGYMASDIWLRTILIVIKETRCRHIGYSYRLTARVLLYAPSHRQDNTYHCLCYTSRGALAGTRNSFVSTESQPGFNAKVFEWVNNVLYAANHTYIYIYIYTHVHTRVCARTCTKTYTRVCVCVCVHMHTYIHSGKCTNLCYSQSKI